MTSWGLSFTPPPSLRFPLFHATCQPRVHVSCPLFLLCFLFLFFLLFTICRQFSRCRVWRSVIIFLVCSTFFKIWSSFVITLDGLIRPSHAPCLGLAFSPSHLVNLSMSVFASRIASPCLCLFSSQKGVMLFHRGSISSSFHLVLVILPFLLFPLYTVHSFPTPFTILVLQPSFPSPPSPFQPFSSWFHNSLSALLETLNFWTRGLL